MNEEKELIKTITEGIQEKKGKKIVVADLTEIGCSICSYFVICQGNSPSQVDAIVESIREYVHKEAHVKPAGVDGQKNDEWVAMDYQNILVHVFLPDAREYYNLEGLWADAKLTNIADID
jgi:ribosome-associated protein